MPQELKAHYHSIILALSNGTISMKEITMSHKYVDNLHENITIVCTILPAV